MGSFLKILGGAIVVWGFADIGLSYAEVDLWWEVGIDTGELYPFTHWIAFGVGAIITFIGRSIEDNPSTDD